ncbi:MAG: hypothetical protein FJ096_00950 [Deltaproteobacteria bacterium]|nr:hypothetical protein [Deltaproteobacteria bacterium]
MSRSLPRGGTGAAPALTALLVAAAACGGGDVGGTAAATGTGGGATASTSSAGGGEGGTTTTGGGSGGATASSSTATGSGGEGGAAFVPEPIPTIEPEPPAACANIPGGYFQFLDDACKARQEPSFVDRDLACPSLDTSAEIPLKDGGTVTYQPGGEEPKFDTAALSGIVPSELMATVILIRRVNGKPHYRYLSTGDHEVPYQPWSTTKVFAAANAAARLRIASGYGVGLTAKVDGKPLGDFVTSICNYDGSPYSSNALGRYFHNVGTRKRANDLIHDLWLKRPAGETFGGNYGENAPGLGYTFVDTADQVTIETDTSAGYANNLSSRTMAEVVKRLVLHREEASQRLPGIQWADIRVLLHGAEGSAKYGEWGGMSADSAIYLQAAHDIDYVEARSHGRWRTFSKLGLGTSGQFLDVGYACMPVLDDADAPVPGWGREFVIAAHLPTGGASWAARDRLLAKSYRAIVTRILDGRL